MADKVDGHVTVKECRELRHAQITDFNVAIMRIGDDVADIAKSMTEIKVDSARREQKLENVSAVLSSHMKEEDEDRKETIKALKDLNTKIDLSNKELSEKIDSGLGQKLDEGKFWKYIGIAAAGIIMVLGIHWNLINEMPQKIVESLNNKYNITN